MLYNFAMFCIKSTIIIIDSSNEKQRDLSLTWNHRAGRFFIMNVFNTQFNNTQLINIILTVHPHNSVLIYQYNKCILYRNWKKSYSISDKLFFSFEIYIQICMLNLRIFTVWQLLCWLINAFTQSMTVKWHLVFELDFSFWSN